MTTNQQINAILGDPSASFWVKDAIKTLLGRDPVDAANDAEVLSMVFQARADEILAL